MDENMYNKNAYIKWKLQGVYIVVYCTFFTNTFVIPLYIYNYINYMYYIYNTWLHPYIFNTGRRRRMAFATYPVIYYSSIDMTDDSNVLV
jgi:hypothetical protein